MHHTPKVISKVLVLAPISYSTRLITSYFYMKWLFFVALPIRYLWRKARMISNLLCNSPSIPVLILDSLSLFFLYTMCLVYFSYYTYLPCVFHYSKLYSSGDQFIVILCKLFIILSNKHVGQKTVMSHCIVLYWELNCIALLYLDSKCCIILHEVNKKVMCIF